MNGAVCGSCDFRGRAAGAPPCERRIREQHHRTGHLFGAVAVLAGCCSACAALIGFGFSRSPQPVFPRKQNTAVLMALMSLRDMASGGFSRKRLQFYGAAAASLLLLGVRYLPTGSIAVTTHDHHGKET